jgi:uncharacterized membrane protein YeaQ/YmgE (transglycosylase-associated protein family)
MGLLSWIVFGALAGWVASLLMGRGRRMGCLANVFVGIIGAVLGGFLMNLLGAYEVASWGWDLRSFGVAVLGAIVFLGVTGWWSKRSKK